MKQLLLILLGLATQLSSSAQSKKLTDTKIDKVTVFLEGAQVQRSARVSLTAGKQEIVFHDISPEIDKQSIQVKADGNITIVSVIHQPDHLREQKKQQEITDLETALEVNAEKIETQKNIIAVFRQEETMLLKNQQVSGANTGLKTADLKEAVDFQRTRLTEVYQKLAENERQLKILQSSSTAIQKQLKALNLVANISTSQILVTVNSKTAISAAFTISYLVRKAGWYPTYDIRVKDIVSPVNLQFKANVFQTSGEDWKEVRLSLSTGNPSVNNNVPTVNPWYLRYLYASQPVILRGLATIEGTTAARSAGRVTDEKGHPVLGVSIQVKGTNIGTSTDGNGLYTVAAPSSTSVLQVSMVGYETQEVAGGMVFNNITLKPTFNALDEVVVIGYSAVNSGSSDDWAEKKSITKVKSVTAVQTSTLYQPTSTVYEIEDPYTVLNDGKTYMVEIDGFDINARYEYYAVPKTEQVAYLTAKILDWQELNLMQGEANIFFEGTFLGQSMLDLTTAGDTLSISLGQDKGVVVKRTLLKEFSSKKFIGSNRTDDRHYEIVVRNNKQQPVSILIEDQFPI
ncbi:MAG: mucoidy inhibitor MuiA family protein, partial [Chitinophagaceae bacterium]